MLAIGVVGMVDLAGASVPASAYLAVPLTVVALGLLLGSWYGRARGLIVVGAMLSVALFVTSTAERLSGLDGSVTWRPTSVAELDRSYKIDIGNAVLDLAALNFAGRSQTVEVSVGVGDLTIIVPPNVDIRAETSVDVGNANVFGNKWGGLGQDTRTIIDNGADGPGGGELVIRASVDVGNVEVHR